MKYEVLDRRSKEILKRLDEELKADKKNMEKLSEQMKNCRDFYSNQTTAITGLGQIAFLIEIFKFAQQKQALQNYAEKMKMSEEMKEFMQLQKERFDLVNEATKNGLNVDINPEKDVEAFLRGEKDFAPEEVKKYFEYQKDVEKYGALTGKVVNFIKNIENKFESKDESKKENENKRKEKENGQFQH